MLHTVTRILTMLVLGAVLAVPASGVAAQATPEGAAGNPFTDLGLPELAVTITDTAFEGVPAELTAGRYVLAVTNATTPPEEGPPETAGAAFLQAPDGTTAVELVEELSGMAATPEAVPDEASPIADATGGDAPPPWYYETEMAGGVYAYPDETGYAVVDLSAGEWILWAEFPGAPQAPVPVTVTDEPPPDQPAPTPDVIVQMSEFAFAIEPPLTAGSHVIELANIGAQPHFLFLGTVPDGTTVEDVLALIATFDPAATPAATPAGGLAFEDITEVLSTGDQSAGVTAWYSVDLAAGTYVAVCFVTDPETGQPHAMLGMIEVLVVE